MGSDYAKADDGVGWVTELVRELRIPGLGAHGISNDYTAELVAKAAQASSMKANPVQLTAEDLASLKEAAVMKSLRHLPMDLVKPFSGRGF